MRTRTRSESTGSSTDPTVPLSFAPSSSADGFLTDLPRPTNLERSVSQVMLPTRSGPHATTWAHQIPASVADRGRLVARSAAFASSHSVCTNRLWNAGWPRSASGLQRPVGQRYPPHFGGVIVCNGDFRDGVDLSITTSEGDSIAREPDVIPLGLGAARVIGGGPHVAGRQILDEAELVVVVTGAVVTPARDSEISVAAVSPAGVGDERGIGNAPEHADHRLRRVRSLHLAHRRLLGLARHSRGVVALDILDRQPARYALLQHQLGGSHERIGVEPAWPDLLVQHVVERDETHADVVSHVRADDRLSRSRRRSRIIERIAESIGAKSALALEHGEVLERLVRLDQHCEHRCIGSDDQLLAQAALEREVGHAEAAVLIGVRAIAYRIG